MSEPDTMKSLPSDKVESLLNALCDVFAYNGAALEVMVISEASAKVEHFATDESGFNSYDLYQLVLAVPREIYSQIADDKLKTEIENAIYAKADDMVKPHIDGVFRWVRIIPDLSKTDPQWRQNARNLLAGDGITNQGRAHSDNIAGKTYDGLLFRSQPEIYMYQALKKSGVPFAPLPVFVRGGSEFRRMEPDFIIMKDRVVMHVEIDGDTFHKESPADAHNRASVLTHEGAYLERIAASDCETLVKADASAQKLLKLIEKYKAAR